MKKDFSTTVSGTISQDPATNAITLTLTGIPKADLALFLAWASDWIPVSDSTPPAPGAAAAKK